MRQDSTTRILSICSRKKWFLQQVDTRFVNLMQMMYLGTGHYLSPGGGRSIFVVTSEHLPDPPVSSFLKIPPYW